MVLEHFGIRVGKERGRIPDPFTSGHNPTSFSYERDKWFSFKLGRGGDVFSLAMELGAVSFRDALTLCAKIVGIRLGRVDPTVARRAITERLLVADQRRAENRRWWDRWWTLIYRHDDLEEACFIVRCARRRDPRMQEQLTRAIVRQFAGAIRRRDELEEEIDALEREWRAWAAQRESTRPRRAGGGS